MAILISMNRLAAWRRGGLLAWLIVAFALPAGAQTGAQGYPIKAVFLYNFTLFVEWPSFTFPDAKSPMTIGVLGDDPFGPILDEAVRGEQASGRNLVVRRYRLVEEIGSCQILFISRSEMGRLGTILRALSGQSTLTVSDAENFARAGGIVQFVTDRDRIRLRINVDAAKAAHLAISSKLLRSVEVVTGDTKAAP